MSTNRYVSPPSSSPPPQHTHPPLPPQDWIHTREAIDTDYTHPAQDPSSTSLADDHLSSAAGAHHHGGVTHANKQGSASAAAAATRTPYIPVPEDSAGVNSACPICQERFEMKWLDEAQEWVWTDALRVGGRVFHASCHREAYGAQALVQSSAAQGQGVLGKRKAEVCFFFLFLLSRCGLVMMVCADCL